MLKQACKCKGSMRYVHENCLVTWLTQQNIRQCELCKENFICKEEYGNIIYIIKNNFKYLFADKRRLIKLGIYSLYIYLFAKRLSILTRYFKDLTQKINSLVYTGKAADIV
mmetsp:Transcript_14221/g.10282  ORF Transcript_14221/g.10282 Transcript_14221/m.10282 type:complete len:111 (+) Transcript_14221:141-473(+)